MVLAVAALLLQFQSFAPPVQTVSVGAPVITAAAGNFSEENAPVTPSAHAEADVITATTETSSSQLNLDDVHLVDASAKSRSSGTLQTVALETREDAQSFSTVRIPDRSTKENSVKEALELPSRRSWLALALVQHGAAAFDAYSTRQAVGHGASEDNPLLRPFAGSPAIYVATQVAPVLFDLMARHMQRSEYPLVRRLWWMPQTMSAGLSIFSGVHNLNVAGRP
ncbi:MAG: hypothetical protein WA192_12805 [Candidatus Acidiferrales bacterium]